MATETETVDLERLARRYVKIRDLRKQEKAEWMERDQELEAKMDIITATFLDHMNKNKLTKFGTSAGTVFKKMDIKPNVQDWGRLYAWIKKYDAFDILEKRVKKTFVQEFMDDHDGKVPPGLDVKREFTAVVRRGDG